MSGGPDDELLGDRVHQASSMIAAGIDCSVDEAMNRLRILSRSHGQTMEHTALDVLDGVIRVDR